MEADATRSTVDRLSKREAAGLLILLMLASALRLYYFVGASYDDDLGFIGKALGVLKNSGEGMNDQILRRMVYLPIAWLWQLTGGMNLFGTHAYHFACSLFMITAVFFIARSLFGSVAGFFGAIFLTVIPLHVIFTTRIMPSIPEAAWGAGAMWLLIWTDGRNRSQKSIFYEYPSFFGGVLIGVAYLCRETAIVLLAAPLVYYGIAFLTGRGGRRVRLMQAFLVVAGFALIFAIEARLNYLWGGDYLARWHIVQVAQANVPNVPGSLFYLRSLLNVIDSGGDRFFIWNSPYYSPVGWLGYPMLLALLLYLLFCSRGRALLISLWFLAYFIFLSFGSASIHHYQPMRKFVRYELLFFVPASIIVGWMFSKLYLARFGKYIAVSAIATAAGIGLYFTHFNYIQYHSYFVGAKAVLELMEKHVTDKRLPIYLDIWHCALLNYWNGYKEDWYKLRVMDEFNGDTPNGAYVFAKKRNSDGKFVAPMDNKPFMEDIPERWVKLAEANLAHWDFHWPGQSPVLFYAPPTAPPFADEAQTLQK